MFLLNYFRGRDTQPASVAEQAPPKKSKMLTSDEKDQFFQWIKAHEEKPGTDPSREWLISRFNKNPNYSDIGKMIDQAMTQKIMWRYDVGANPCHLCHRVAAH